MKLSVSKGKYILDKESLKDLFMHIFDKGQQNGRLIEAGIGLDRTEEEWAIFFTSQPDLKPKRINKRDLATIVDLSKSIEQRKLEFAERIAEFKHLHSRDKLKAFYSYWIEKNPNDVKMLFEKREVFDIERRLERFNFRENLNQNATKPSTEDAIRSYLSEKDH